MTHSDILRIAGYFGIGTLSLVLGATLFPSRTTRNIGRLMGIKEYAKAVFFFVMTFLVTGSILGVLWIEGFRQTLLLVSIWAYLLTELFVTLALQSPRVKEEINNDAEHTD